MMHRSPPFLFLGGFIQYSLIMFSSQNVWRVQLGVMLDAFPVPHSILTENFFELIDVLSGFTKNCIFVVDGMGLVTDGTC